MQIKKPAIVIVDAYSTGRYYAPVLYGYGYQCIHVVSNVDISDYFRDSFDPYNFHENIILNTADLNSVIKQLKKYQITAVIAGCETGVNIADAIANNFTVARNDLLTSDARRNKFLMIDALQKAGLPCAQQFRADNVDDMINWFKKSEFKKVILKPTMSASSEDVNICKNSNDIKNAFLSAYKKKNRTGQINKELVLQEFLEGPEYMVNSVSSQGNHFITDIWVGVGGIKDRISTDQYADLIGKNTAEFQILSCYVKKVLDAVGIQNGAAHSEVKNTATGPKLIEVGARLTGGLDFSIVHECQGYSQLSIAVEAILNPNLFCSRIDTYQNLPQKLMRFVYFCSEIEGKIVKEPDLNVFLKLDSVASVVFFHRPGDYLRKTNDIVGRPGYIFMLSDNSVALEKDYAKLRKLERKMYSNILGI